MKSPESRPSWKPAPIIKVSVLIILIMLAAMLWHPELWPWTLGVIMLDHFVLSMIGLWPRSSLLGPNMLSLPPAAARRGEVAITIDDGPSPDVTPQVLDILDRFGVQATFFCIGELTEQYPDLCREVIRRGHSIENHSQHHDVLFSLFGPWKTHRELQHAQEVLSDITGHTPRYFRATAGFRNMFLDPVLVRLDLQLVTWSKRGFDTRETNPEVILERLLRDLKGGDILMLHDGNAARTADGKPVIVEVLPRLLDQIAQAGLRPVTLSSASR